MAENWAGIAAEVDAALKSVASTDAGYPIALRKVVVTGGNPWDPGSGTSVPSYSTLYGIEDNRMLRDINGTLIGTTLRTITVSAVGTVPAKADKIAVGIAEADADESSPWVEIAEVRPLAPAGTAVLYELDLVA